MSAKQYIETAACFGMTMGAWLGAATFGIIGVVTGAIAGYFLGRWQGRRVVAHGEAP
jgi:membrane protein DedA with SNARE-associated domain